MVNNKEYDELIYQSDLQDALLTLENMPAYRKVMQHYTQTHQNSLVDSLATSIKRGESTDTIDAELRAISFFKQFLNQVHINGNSAKESLNLEDE